MATNSRSQDTNFYFDRIQLFDIEIRPSRALTIINLTLVGTGAMLFIAAPICYWINQASIPEEDFGLIGCYYSGPTLEEKAVILFCMNVFAAVIGAFFYGIQTASSPAIDRKERQKRKPMKVTLWRESNPLSKVKVAAPCPAEWKYMYGNDRVRFCNQCQLNVYNLSAMTKPEAEDLIRNTEGRLCVKYYRRTDGTILTQNCPVALRAIKEKFTRTRTHIIGAVFSLLSLFSFIGASKFAIWTTKSIESIAHPYEREIIGVMEAPYHPKTVQMSESFLREKAIFKVSPVYHATNGSRRITGEAVVKVIISENGEVENAELIKGNPILKELAEDAASRWKFESMYSDNLAAKIESQLTFHFSIYLK
jgi:TonB family protein